jgi:hypothetical protein
MVPRPEAEPTALALYLLSDVPFALLLPINIATQACASNLYPDIPHAVVKTAFVAAGKLTMLATQMLWVIGDVPNCAPIEVFESTLTTTAPLMEDISPDNPANEFSDPVPKSIEEWKEAQDAYPDFAAMLDGIENVAVRNGLCIFAPPGGLPKIIVPPSMQESLTRYQHLKMYHLGSDVDDDGGFEFSRDSAEDFLHRICKSQGRKPFRAEHRMPRSGVGDRVGGAGNVLVNGVEFRQGLN